MITSTYLVEMAAYNAWQNQRLLAACEQLDEEELGAERGLFFGSVLATLNHILILDKLLLRYVRDGIPPTSNLPAPHHTFALFLTERGALDEEIAAFASTATADWLAETVPIWEGRHVPRALLLIQMFNHQTHHRSQITTHLYLMGIDYGCTDIPFCPGSQWA